MFFNSVKHSIHLQSWYIFNIFATNLCARKTMNKQENSMCTRYVFIQKPSKFHLLPALVRYFGVVKKFRTRLWDSLALIIIPLLSSNNCTKIENLEKSFYGQRDHLIGNLSSKSQHQNSTQSRSIFNKKPIFGPVTEFIPFWPFCARIYIISRTFPTV